MNDILLTQYLSLNENQNQNENELDNIFQTIKTLNIKGPCTIILEDDFIEFKGYLNYCEIISDGELTAEFSSDETNDEDAIEEIKRISPRSMIEKKIDFRKFNTYMDDPSANMNDLLIVPHHEININPDIVNTFKIPYKGKINKIMISNHVNMIIRSETNYSNHIYLYILHYSRIIINSKFLNVKILSIVLSNNSHMIHNNTTHKYINISKRMYVHISTGSTIDVNLSVENNCIIEILCNHLSLANIKFIQSTGNNIFKYYFRWDDNVFITDVHNNKRLLLDHSQWNENFV